MPIEYRIEPERGFVRVVMSGAVGDEDFREFRERIGSDPAVAPGLPRLYDLREVSTPPSTAQIRALVSVIVSRALPQPALRAIVVASDVAFGMFRMLVTLLEGHTREQFRVFRSLDEAERWLGGDSGSATPLPSNGVR